jgi:hypothetical protein
MADSGGVRLKAGSAPFEFTINYPAAANMGVYAVGILTFAGTAGKQIYNFDFRTGTSGTLLRDFGSSGSIRTGR